MHSIHNLPSFERCQTPILRVDSRMRKKKTKIDIVAVVGSRSVVMDPDDCCMGFGL